jgi:hypothetical protein
MTYWLINGTSLSILLRSSLAPGKKVRDLLGDPPDRVFKIRADAVVTRGENRNHNVTVCALEYSYVVAA